MRPLTQDDGLAALAGGLLAVTGALAAQAPRGGARRAPSRLARARRSLAPPLAGRHGQAQRRTARLLNGGCAALAFAALADSAIEHYRGRFFNPAMAIPLVSAALALGASLHGAGDRGAAARRGRELAYGLAALTGLVGTGIHLYNVGKRPGRFSFHNLFYGAPLGAPGSLLIAGVLGGAAEAVRGTRPGRVARLFGLPAGRALAALTAAGLAGTVAEAGLLHFRGAFQNPAMYLPVTVPPVAAGLMAAAALDPKPKKRPLTRLWLKLTALLGIGGVGFHAFGVGRMMGGWRNWSQNVTDGPPLPAPPSFGGLALAGLAALGLIERRGHG
jgi:hypothetical protein